MVNSGLILPILFLFCMPPLGSSFRKYNTAYYLQIYQILKLDTEACVKLLYKNFNEADILVIKDRQLESFTSASIRGL